MPSPETATLPVPPPALDLHQALWYATGRIRFTIMWAEFVAAWLLSVAIFFGIGFIDPASTPLGFVDLYLGAIVFAPTGVYAILQARRAQLSLGDWETQMIPFMYSVKFEMFPFVGDDRERDIWERFVSIFPELERMWKPNGILPWTRRKTYVKFRATVRGKENEHFFHIFGRYRDDEVFVVRRYEEDEPVTNEDLATLKDEIEDVLRKLGIHEFMVATFAAGGYEPDAIKYAASEESLVDGEQPIDLFTETVKGYEVAFASTDYDSGSL